MNNLESSGEHLFVLCRLLTAFYLLVQVPSFSHKGFRRKLVTGVGGLPHYILLALLLFTSPTEF